MKDTHLKLNPEIKIQKSIHQKDKIRVCMIWLN